MLNKLSAHYQKEIALSFISLFFISGLSSLKAQTFHAVAYQKSNIATNYFASNNKQNKMYKALEKATVKNQSREADKIKIITPVAIQKEAKAPVTKKIILADGKAPKALLIGGPGQPEMGAFKPAGADNMVSPFTGDFSYNIPLLDVGGYPVNIFYNSGITMDQEASWVGLGWNINPGTIMRNMRGLPDDFNGKDIITKRQSMRPDKTWGVSGGAGIKFAGYPIGGGISVNAGLSFNNRLGVALEAGIHPSLNISRNVTEEKTAALSFGANLSVNSRSGAAVTPSIELSLSKKNGEYGTRSSLGTSYTYHSRMGITGMHLEAGVSKSRTIGRMKDDGTTGKEFASGSASTLNSSISFAYPTVIPSIKNIFTRKSYNLSFSVGGEAFALNAHARISGYFTETIIDDGDKETKHPAYGMLNYQEANNNPDALLDFNRANDGVYTPNSPSIAMPVYTYDVFSISGEGTGGSFKATRGDVGFMRDASVKSKDSDASLGVDLGFGNTLHGGAEFSYAHTSTTVGAWKVNNMAKDVFNFKENEHDYQAVYFKNPGEKTIPDPEFQNAIANDSLVRLKMSNIGSGTPTLLPNIIKYDANKNKVGEMQLTAASVTKKDRDKRTQVINFLTAEEAARVGFDKKIYSYDSSNTKMIFGACNKNVKDIEPISRVSNWWENELYRKANHISEIDVLGTDGRKYVYGIPVYNTKQVDVSFSIENGDKNTSKSTYNPGTDDTTGNTKGRDWFMEQQETPAYAHSFLLTALLSPNYVDVTGDGITEDDMGDGIKFNYTKFSKGYRWRTPIGGNIATYSEGLKTDNKDDKAHYVYGEREMWNLYSIESKNMVARFYVKNDRKDCRQVIDQTGKLDNNWGAQRLDKICLFSKGDLMKLGDKAKPIKTVQFFQSYKLCKNADGTTNSVINEGKLTLDSIWFTYNGNVKKAKSKYAFYYPNDKNPKYNYNHNDRWGNYKPLTDGQDNNPGGLNNADYPYTVQDKTKADKYAAAWTMNKILLPSGGVINVEYEADDYAYVQNKKAASMCQVLGFGNTKTPDAMQQKNKNLYQGFIEYNYVYIKLPLAVTGNDIAEKQKDLTARYFENTKQLYMKLAVKMPPKPGIEGSEMIPVYADIAEYGLVTDDIAYVKVQNLEGGSTPMVQQALQFIKQQLPSKAYPGYEVKDEGTAKSIVLALAGMMQSIAALKMGDDNALKLSSKCKEVETDKSFARLTNPYFKKYGGGLRVKKVVINDNWNTMTKQYEATYGQEYVYTTTAVINGKPTTISSGVAAWEPAVGSDENPYKDIMRFMNHNKGGPYDFGAIEMPLGEMFYPSPMIGYSRVEVLSIHRDTVKNLPTRQVTEFYTTKDFPFTSTCTSLTDPEANVKYEPKAILQLLKLDMKKAVTQSQGFLVDMNDMNGKIKIQSTYSALDSVNPVSFTQNFYNVEKATDSTYKFNHIFPTINKADGVVHNNGLIGRDIELMADFRQHRTETTTTNLSVNFDFFFIGIFPVPLLNLLQPQIYEGMTYRSAAILKVVNHYGMLDSVVSIDKGSMVSTKNLVYDAETGNPLLTRTNNEHDKPVYNFSYPAHWAYSGMGPAYKNIDAVYENLTFRHGILETPIDMSIFESGDEMYVFSYENKGPKKDKYCDGIFNFFNAYLPKNPNNKIWAVNTAKVGSLTPQMVFMDANGNPYTAKEVSLKIIRSGHRNMLDQTVGSITSMNNPIKNNKLVFDDAANIVQTSAATFKDHWRVDNDFYLFDTTIVQPVYARVKRNDYSPGDYLNVTTNKKGGDPSIYSASKNLFLHLHKKTKKLGLFNHSQINATRGFLLFDFNWNPLPANAMLYSAFLSLYSHTNTLNKELSADHPGSHGNSFSQTPFRLAEIKSLKSNWFNVNNSKQWGTTYFATNQNLSAQSAIIPHAIIGNENYDMTYNGKFFSDKRINVSNIVAENFGSPLNNLKQLGLQLRLVNDIPSGKIPTEEFQRCFWSHSGKFGGPGPQLSYYYYICGDTSLNYNNPEELDPYINTLIKCPSIKVPTGICRSKFTRKAMNPYAEGVLGNWRVDSTYAYYSDRKETDPAAAIDTRTAGAISKYQGFWNFNANDLQRNIAAKEVWVWNSTITQYNRKGYEIENKDPLGRFNSGLYGYNQQLPIAVANNARVREVMFDGFEDYDYQTALNCITCKPHRRTNFDSSMVNNIDASQKHTGRYSLRVEAGQNIALNTPITDDKEADKGYGLRVKVDSIMYKVFVVTQKGTGLTAKYLKYNKKNTDAKMLTEGNNALINIDNNPAAITRIDPNINLGQAGGMYAPPFSWGNFVARWRGYMQAPKSGIYSFKVNNDDRVRLWIDGALKINNWGGVGVTYHDINLSLGQVYTIQIDYMDTHAGGLGMVSWKEPGSASYSLIPKGVLYTPNDLGLTKNNIISTTHWCTKLDSSQVLGNALTDTFSLLQGKKMLVSAWVKENINDCKCSSYVKNRIFISYTGNNQKDILKPTGNIIEGWQRYESAINIPANATAMKLLLQNTSNAPVFFDDIRIHPFNANVKSFVYHSSSLRLMSELDENNYASFYEYDDDGTLIRVKKETSKGIKTITETRSAMQKAVQ
jgi:hypothetical protein